MKKEPATAEINKDDVFTINDSFQSQSRKVSYRYIVTIKLTEQGHLDIIKIKAKIMEDRSAVIDAAIVRLLKFNMRMKQTEVELQISKYIKLFKLDMNVL